MTPTSRITKTRIVFTMTMITTSVSMPLEKSGSPAGTGLLLPPPGGGAAGPLRPRSRRAEPPGASGARSPESLHAEIGDRLVGVDELARAGTGAVHGEERGARRGPARGGRRGL